jgi:hypothetical protein
MEINFKNKKGEIIKANVIKEYTYKKTGKVYLYVKLENNKKRLINKNKIV